MYDLTKREVRLLEHLFEHLLEHLLADFSKSKMAQKLSNQNTYQYNFTDEEIILILLGDFKHIDQQ